MTREQIVATLKGFLIRELFVETPLDSIKLDAGLQSVLGVDSVGFLELRVLCERDFNLSIPDTDFNPANFQSLDRLADLVQRLRREQVGA